MQQHISAGGIVMNVDDTPPTILISQHSGHKGWGFPKGHIEKGEKPEETAVREVREETGIDARITDKAGSVRYVYTQDGEKHFKTVTFFLMGARTTEFKLSWEMQDAAWVLLEEVEEKLTFETEKDLWRSVKHRIPVI
ncbi:MAG: NUDIX domain-containing protein [bacterium]|nr:NUDIX domain-containing protein [bacterium]